MEGIFSNFRQNKRIQLKRKLEIIEYAKYHGNNEAVKFGGVCTKTIRKWRKNEEEFKKFKIQIKKLHYIKVDLKQLIMKQKNKFMNGFRLTEV